MLKRILKLLLGIISFPVCIAASLTLYEQLNQIKTLSYNERYFLLGIAAYLIIHTVFFKPTYIYILGHELMHALATWISGGKVSSFKVSSQGGKVTTNKSNIFIALAPYFFPLYTIVVALIFFAMRFIVEASLPQTVFFFLVGFTFSFHIILTIDFLKIRQTDFLHGGYLFSICLIYIVNIVIIGAIFSLLFDEIVFLEFIRSIYLKTKYTCIVIYRQLFL